VSSLDIIWLSGEAPDVAANRTKIRSFRFRRISPVPVHFVIGSIKFKVLRLMLGEWQVHQLSCIALLDDHGHVQLLNEYLAASSADLLVLARMSGVVSSASEGLRVQEYGAEALTLRHADAGLQV
jgi:hypothetical protein